MYKIDILSQPKWRKLINLGGVKMEVKCQNYLCVYNAEDGKCFTGVIEIKGRNATKVEETLCGSFIAKDGDFDLEVAQEFLSNNRVCATTESIECEANNCVFNKNQHCYAQYVEIAEQDAPCLTFKKK